MQQAIRDDLGIYMKDTLENIILEMPVDTKLLMFPMIHGRADSEVEKSLKNRLSKKHLDQVCLDVT